MQKAQPNASTKKETGGTREFTTGAKTLRIKPILPSPGLSRCPFCVRWPRAALQSNVKDLLVRSWLEPRLERVPGARQ
jgi:hypothetical protein